MPQLAAIAPRRPRGAHFGSARALVVVAAGSAAAFVAVLIVVVSAGGTTPFDTTISEAVVALRTPAMTVVATAITTLGTFPLLVGLAVLAAVAMWIQTRRIDRSALMLLGLATVAGTVFLLKIAVGRHRPPTVSLVGSPSWDYAFPSGHTANGTVAWVLAAVLLTAGLARWARSVAVVAGCLVSIMIGCSRVYLGYHWMTDVIAGWLIAATIICLTLFLGSVGVLDWITSRSVLNGRVPAPELDPTDQHLVIQPTKPVSLPGQTPGDQTVGGPGPGRRSDHASGPAVTTPDGS